MAFAPAEPGVAPAAPLLPDPGCEALVQLAIRAMAAKTEATLVIAR